MNQKCGKEQLIEMTILLIKKHQGNVNEVTIREICKECNVSVGLINYHFGNKDQLITVCTQRIISKVIEQFHPVLMVDESITPFEAAKKRLKDAANQVFQFLFDTPEISRLSILNDYQNYGDNTNSWKSIDGFSSVIGNGIFSKEKKALISFYLINSMQVAFLKHFEVHRFLGYDFSLPEDREIYINNLVDTLLRGQKDEI